MQRLAKARQKNVDNRTRPPGRRFPTWLPFVAVFGLACTVRLVLASQMAGLPIVRTPWLDSAEYLQWAHRLAAGHLAWPAAPSHGPGYPFFLAAIFALFGDSPPVVLSVQALVGGVGCVLTALIGAHLFDRRSGLIAGALQAVNGPLALADTSLLAEGLLIFLMLLAVWAITRQATVRWRTISGLALGLAAVTRPTALLLAPVLLWQIVARPETSRTRLRETSAFLLACALVVTPVVAENWRAAGDPMIQGFGGMNFYLGNSPDGDGLPSARPGAGWQLFRAEGDRAGVHGLGAQDRYFMRKAFDEIRHKPLAYLRLLLAKALWTVQAEEIRDTHSYYFFVDRIPFLRYLPGFGWTFSLAALGLLVAVRQRRDRLALILGYVAATAATCVVLVVGSRYRLPMVPPLILLAGYSVNAVIRTFEQVEETPKPGARTLALGLATIVAAFAVTQVRAHAASHDLCEEWAYTGKSLETEQRMDEAEQALRRAVAIDTRSEFAWDELGSLLVKQGRTTEGREALARAASLNPRYPDAVFHLGLTDEREQKYSAAAANFRRAVALSPERPAYREALARGLLEAGDYEAAEPLFADLVRQFPDKGPLHVGLAILLNFRGQKTLALQEAQTAASLDPRNPQAWLILARTAIDAGNFTLAQSATGAAERLIGPGAPDVRALNAELRALWTVQPR